VAKKEYADPSGYERDGKLHYYAAGASPGRLAFHKAIGGWNFGYEVSVKQSDWGPGF